MSSSLAQQVTTAIDALGRSTIKEFNRAGRIHTVVLMIAADRHEKHHIVLSPEMTSTLCLQDGEDLLMPAIQGLLSAERKELPPELVKKGMQRVIGVLLIGQGPIVRPPVTSFTKIGARAPGEEFGLMMSLFTRSGNQHSMVTINMDTKKVAGAFSPFDLSAASFEPAPATTQEAPAF